jgi:uncharacterized repeat protein (TIGR01451 family)
VINATISGNDGGGIRSTGDAALVTVRSSTITDNQIGTNGGGIRNDAPASRFRVEASIVAGNRDVQGDVRALYPDCFGAFTSWGYNLVGNAGTLATNCAGFGQTADAVGTVTTPIDARLGALASNGGATRTHALLVGSPAVDAGALGISGACPSVDQRGVARPIDGDGNGFTHCDKGAFEAPRARADLQVTLGHAPQNPLTGSAVELRAEVRNGGPYIANGSTLAFALPSGFAFVSADGGCSASGGVVTCSLGNLASGQQVARTVRLTAPATAGSRSASASVTTNSVDPVASNDSAQTTIVVRIPSADLAVGATGPARVAPGDPVAYAAAVRNLGPDAAASVILDATLRDAGRFAATDGCTVAASGLAIQCRLGTLAAGEQRRVALPAVAPPTEGQQRLDVVVSTTALDPLSSNDRASWTTVVQAPRADLALTKQAATQALAGGTVRYLLRVENLGPDGATGVVVRDVLPAGATYAGGAMACGESAGVVTCTSPTLAAGDATTFGFDVNAPAEPGTLRNEASVEADQLDPVAANDVAVVETELLATAPDAADLTLDKAGPAVVAPGATLAYTLTVTNLGPAAADDVVVSDILPAGVTVTTLDPACDLVASEVTCALGPLAAGASAALALEVTAPLEPGEIVNRAVVRTATSDPVASNDADQVTTVVAADGGDTGAGATLTFAAETLADATATPADTAVPVLRFAVGADAQVALGALRVRVVADPADAPLPGAVRLLHDPNGDGELDDAVILATGAFDALDGVAGLVLSTPFALPAGEERRLAVVVDVPAGTASSWPAQLAVVLGGASLWFVAPPAAADGDRGDPGAEPARRLRRTQRAVAASPDGARHLRLHPRAGRGGGCRGGPGPAARGGAPDGAADAVAKGLGAAPPMRRRPPPTPRPELPPPSFLRSPPTARARRSAYARSRRPRGAARRASCLPRRRRGRGPRAARARSPPAAPEAVSKT